MTDPLPPAPPTAAEITCRRCVRRVLVAQTAVLKWLVYLDPEPTAAGVYAIGPDGSAVRLTPAEIAPGQAMYAIHQCAAPAPPDEEHP